MSATVAAAILAGGRARRMGGRQKALVDIAGQTILDRQLAAIADLAAPVAVVARETGAAKAYAGRNLVLLADPPAHAGQGPVAGILAALAWSPAPHLLVLACDLPAVRREVIALLVDELAWAQRAGGALDAVVPEVAGRLEPLCAIYGRTALPALAAALAANERSPRAILGAGALAIRTVGEAALRAADPTLATFTNLNDERDLAAYRHLTRER